MSEAELRECQEQDVDNISAILSVSKAEASILLLHCHWNLGAVTDNWFSDEKEFRQEVGLYEAPIVEPSDAKEVACGICSETLLQNLMAAASCGHFFCKKCWAAYIKNSLKEISLSRMIIRCPELLCHAALTPAMIDVLASEEDKHKYPRHNLEFYMANKKAKWCPAPGCNNAVVLLTGFTTSKATCKCFHSFCWRCSKEAHKPLTCSTVTYWEMESLRQSEKWSMANSTLCPKCERPLPIKDHYRHTQCSECESHFCRLCLGGWLDYGHWDGDLFMHVCSEQKFHEVQNRKAENRSLAQSSMRKYNDYYDQWKTHDRGQLKAIKELQKLQNEKLEKLAYTQRLSESEVSFVADAWMQIADCKRILKWACVHDYYLTGNEDKKLFCGYLLGQAKVILARLQQSADELRMFIDLEGPSDQFAVFRDHLCLATRVARNYFENVIWALEKNPSDLNTLRELINSKKVVRGIPAEATAAKAGSSSDSKAVVDEAGHWDCAYCRFLNDASATFCVMCYQ